MDYWTALKDLHMELQRLDRAIAVLQGMQADVPRRGRKSMNEAERRRVSERMREYWQRRRSGGASATA